MILVPLLALLLPACGGGGGGPASPEGIPTVLLPLEVIGPPGTVRSLRLELDDPSGVDALYLKLHRPGYNAPDRNPVNPGGAKASVRLNGGLWIPLRTGSVRVHQPEAAMGGIGGAADVVGLEVPFSGVGQVNVVEFRFNRTDGNSSGFRVLEANFLRGGTKVLPPSRFVQDDPSAWRPSTTDSAEWEEGERLWEEAPLRASPLDVDGPIRARCADCHAADARDLKYFNYSDLSIIERSVFHGLSRRQGELIAAYVRSRATPAPASARPWSPPYQPGPGLDGRAWSAGAGLAWLLKDDTDTLPHLFPSGTTRASLRSVADRKATLNLRELPIALPMPDWNRWLPLRHPIDVWGDLFLQGEAQQGYLSARQTLVGVVADANLPGVFDRIYLGCFDFLGRGGRTYNNNTSYPWLVLSGTVIDARPPDLSVEEAKLALASWAAVKMWELVQRFGLEARTAAAFPAGERRAWPSRFQSVFHLAPHMIADNRDHFAWQSAAAGDVLNNSWYHLQMLLNAGQRTAGIVDPVDWDYSLRHVYQMGEATGLWQAARYLATTIKMYQERDNGQGPRATGWMLRMMHPRWLFSDERKNQALMATLDANESGLRARATAVLLEEWLEAVAQPEFALSAWPRLQAAQVNQPSALFEAWYRLEPYGYAPSDAPYAGGLFYPLTFLNHADAFHRTIPEWDGLGVDPTVLRRLADWCRAAWGGSSWDSLVGP